MRLPVYILAGGRSSRFGADKARAILHGRPLIVRVAEALSPCAARLAVVADRPGKYDDLGLATLVDDHPGLGPLAGLQRSLRDLDETHDGGRGVADSAEWLLLCSCDLSRARASWVERLGAARSNDAQAVVFEGGPKGREPLFALYRLSIRPVVDARLAVGDRSMRGLLDAVRSMLVPLPADWPRAAQINTPDDLRRATAELGHPSTAQHAPARPQ